MNNEKLGLNVFEKALIIILPVILAVIFYFLPSLTPFIEIIPFIPSHLLVDFITAPGAGWINWMLAVIGLISGAFLSIYTFNDILKIELNRENVTVDIFDEKSEIQKSNIESIFKEGKSLVFIDKEGYEIVRENTDHSAVKLKDTFQKFNYPWVNEDPHHHEFFKWTVDHEDISERANTILYERRQAKRDNENERVKDLRHDLMELHIVVKDIQNSQFIRLVSQEQAL